MESKQKILHEAKINFESLKTEKKSVLFSVENFYLKLFKKTKKIYKCKQQSTIKIDKCSRK